METLISPGILQIILSLSGKVISVNDKARKLFKFKEGDLTGQLFSDLCEEYQLNFPLKSIDDLKRNDSITGVLQILKNAQSGRSTYILWSVAKTKYATNDVYILVGIEDFQGYTANNQYREYLRNIINNVPHFIFWKDKESIFQGCNQKFANAGGLFSPDDVIGKSDFDMPWGQDNANTYIEEDQYVMTSKVAKLNYEQYQTQQNGDIHTMLVSKVPMYSDEKQVVGVIGVYTDITAIKKVQADLRIAKEQAEASNKAKDYFLAMVSHELRTPLNGILGMADILLREKLEPHQLEFVNDIKLSGENLQRLVDDILLFSKLEQGNLVFENKNVKLFKMANKLMTSMSYLIKGNSIQLKHEIAQDCPACVSCDQIRLQQVLINIITNAIKFTKKGVVKLTIELIKQVDDVATINFSITDTGMGIPEDKLNIIFNRFVQVGDEPYTRVHGGLGLGLAISNQIIKQMGSEIKVDSKVGMGSRFSFNLDLPIVHEQADALNASKNGKDKKAKKAEKQFNANILLVEDNIINQRVALVMLQYFGCSVTLAETGQQALDILADNPDFDLLLFDIQLPDYNGLDLTKMVRPTISVPIIAITAHAFNQEVERFKSFGINDILLKPINEDNLRLVLEKYL